MKLPRVVIDARMIGPVPHGIARYVMAIAKGLDLQKKKKGGLPYSPIFLVCQNFTQATLASFDVYPLRSSFLNPRELFEIPNALKTLKADLYHSPSFSSLWRCPCPSMITIHDLNHLTYGGVREKIYYRTLLRRFSRRSKAVLTVSEFSKNEIVQWLKIPAKNVEVVYNAIERKNDLIGTQTSTPASIAESVAKSIGETLNRFGLKSKQYFFCLSNSKPHKNLSTLVTAYKVFRKQAADAWPLVLSVTESYNFSGNSSGNSPGIKSVGSLSAEDAEILLRNSAALFFPSEYEGFGLPPVEAAAAGIPLAISDIPPHREGLADLAAFEVHWTAPKDVHGWVSAFHKISRSELSAPCMASQEKVLTRFSTEKMGAELDRIYQRMLGVKA